MKRKLWLIPLLVLCLGLLLVGCTDPQTPPPVEGDNDPKVTISETSHTMSVGSTFTLTATLENLETIEWTFDETVVSVEVEGTTAVVTALATGTTTINVVDSENADTVYASCEITVIENPLSIFLPESGLILKKGVKATVKAISAVQLTGEVTWESSDESVGTVEWQGLTARVTAVARGTCTIYVHADGHTASFQFTVGIS